MKLTYQEWERSIDQIAIDNFGLGIHDFPDYNWRDLYEAGDDPMDAYLEWVEDETYGPKAAW